jgi:choline monooxygenase
LKRFEINSDISRAQTPPGSFYGDPEFHAAAADRVFAASWQLLDQAEESGSKPGWVHPFVLLPGCLDEPLLLVLDDQGGQRCLSNVCTHRGMLLASEPGNLNRLRCGYHGRIFDLTGRMTGMPEFEQAEVGTLDLHGHRAPKDVRGLAGSGHVPHGFPAS